mmetsp:Transcript_27309/g.89836  ORF Transcript_27309/g.89836 Transcript_27309/m.89836 type:complete len:277 (-) Transcript_27309:28-858(-)
MRETESTSAGSLARVPPTPRWRARHLDVPGRVRSERASEPSNGSTPDPLGRQLQPQPHAEHVCQASTSSASLGSLSALLPAAACPRRAAGLRRRAAALLGLLLLLRVRQRLVKAGAVEPPPVLLVGERAHCRLHERPRRRLLGDRAADATMLRRKPRLARLADSDNPALGAEAGALAVADDAAETGGSNKDGRRLPIGAGDDQACSLLSALLAVLNKLRDRHSLGEAGWWQRRCEAQKRVGIIRRDSQQRIDGRCVKLLNSRFKQAHGAHLHHGTG